MQVHILPESLREFPAWSVAAEPRVGYQSRNVTQGCCQLVSGPATRTYHFQTLKSICDPSATLWSRDQILAARGIDWNALRAKISQATLVWSGISNLGRWSLPKNTAVEWRCILSCFKLDTLTYYPWHFSQFYVQQHWMDRNRDMNNSLSACRLI